MENLDIKSELHGDDAAKVAFQWLKCFCPHLTSFSEFVKGKSYLWDELKEFTSNDEALTDFSSHQALNYYIMPDYFKPGEDSIYVTNKKPQGNLHRQDFHVFPKNFAWSMAFTHEDGWLGPKFVKYTNYQQLNNLNIKAVNEVASLKQKWSGG
ncbi:MULTISPECIES: hypothetical protein [Pseudoalteromonas]|uniref:hypothetical protein n=1 Tax=Pseudoalteromonas TaxID=53246 RepID=UPI0006CA2FBD|nr:MULTISPECIES: hypothetical protein [Pseudoalteromonas]MDK9683270.1 hypothetical protein [Pseudoalteromonas shioyasakiensis]